MDILKWKNQFFMLWAKYSEHFIAAGVVLFALFVLYQLMLYLEKSHAEVLVFHEKVTKVLDLIFNFFTRLLAFMIFLVSVFIVVSVIVKLIMVVWTL